MNILRTAQVIFEGADGTFMRDVGDYDLPYGPLGTLARKLFVARQLERIFDCRRDVIADIFC